MFVSYHHSTTAQCRFELFPAVVALGTSTAIGLLRHSILVLSTGAIVHVFDLVIAAVNSNTTVLVVHIINVPFCEPLVVTTDVGVRGAGHLDGAQAI